MKRSPITPPEPGASQRTTAGDACAPGAARPGLLQRVAETDRRLVHFLLDGQSVTALDGDTVLTAILTQHPRLRHNEFSGLPRAGFCLMGACQDCWVETAAGERLRACTSFIQPGLHVCTRPAVPAASEPLPCP